MKFLIKLYPAWWRRRYGCELEALLEDSGSHNVWDLLRGAMKMQMKTRSFGVVAVCGIVGLVIASSMPNHIQSTEYGTDQLIDQPIRIVNKFTRQSRMSTPNGHVYVRAGEAMPMEDLIEYVMRPEIRISPITSNAHGSGRTVRFTYTIARWRISLIGLGIALVFGFVLALILRRRAPAAN